MNQNQSDELHGTVNRFLFKSIDNGFSVFEIECKKIGTVMVRGYTPSLQAGEQVTVHGAWVMHPKFGKQFEATSCTTTLPSTALGLKKYLGSGMIKGIGPVFAEKLVNYFGTDVLDVIEKSPHRLGEIGGIGPGRIDKIVIAWLDQKEIATVMVYLQEKGISPAYAVKIYRRYGQKSIEILNENPYQLADDIWGIGFAIADKIAQNLGIDKHSIKRIKAGILSTISGVVGTGSLYIEVTALKEKATALLELDEDLCDSLLKAALRELYDGNNIVLITHQEQHFVSLEQFYYSEKNVANKIKRLQEYPVHLGIEKEEIDAFLATPFGQQQAELNAEQQEAIRECLHKKVTIITGGPGTGKTTLITKLLSLLDAHHIIYKLAAPTGRAAKRITEGTGRFAATIHRLLEFEVATRSFVHNEENALKTHFLIVDEASMIDIFLANALLKALPLHAHLVLLGDVDQLPSVGAGNFLNDLIASGAVACIRLQHIFRQAQDSLIIMNAHRINHGEFPLGYSPDARRDFFYIKEDDPAQVQAHMQRIFSEVLATHGIANDDAMVLVPMNKGVVGTQQLNSNLQAFLNPGPKEQVMYAGTAFRGGDRVMQIRNNYDKVVFNGDVGIIELIDTPEQNLQVRFYERLVVYEFSELDEIVLAYAVTIHKSQGSEYPAVIVPIFMQHFTLLQRNLIYTAITRAKKLCIFIGQTKAIAMAVHNNKSVKRTTFLQHLLLTDIPCRQQKTD